jgi:tetratricopeptide (TPR) repeat protein
MGTAYERGMLLFRQERWALAPDEFRRELESTPNRARPHAMLCLCLLNSNRRKEAETEGRRAIELDPNYAFAYYALSLIALKEGNPPARFAFAISRQDARRRAYRRLLNASKRLMLTAVELDPLNADFLGQLAAIHFDLGDLRSAVATAERGLAQLPQHQRCADLRARSLSQLGKHREAIATVDRSLATNPEHAAAHATRGWLLMRRGQIREAREHFLEALRVSPHDKRAISGLKAANSAVRPILGFPRRMLLKLPGGARHISAFVGLAIAGANLLNSNADPAGRVGFLILVFLVLLTYAVVIAIRHWRQRRPIKNELHR